MEYVYYASFDKNLKVIPVKGNNLKSVEGSYSKLYELIRGSCKDVLLFYYTEKEDTFIITERVKNALKEHLDKPIYIYYLDSKNFNKLTWTKSIYSDFNEKVLRVECIPSVYQELLKLEKDNKIKFYYYPKKDSFLPKDDSDLIHYAIRKYYLGDGEMLDKLLFFHPNLESQLKKTLGYKQKNNPSFVESDGTWNLPYDLCSDLKTNKTSYKKIKGIWNHGLTDIMAEYAEEGLYYKIGVGDVSEIYIDDISNLPHCHEWETVLKKVYDYPETFFIPKDYLILYSHQEIRLLEGIRRTALLNGLKDISKYETYTTTNKDGSKRVIKDLEYNLEELKKRNYKSFYRREIKRKALKDDKH